MHEDDLRIAITRGMNRPSVGLLRDKARAGRPSVALSLSILTFLPLRECYDRRIFPAGC